MDGVACSKRIRQLEKGGQIKERLTIVGTTANAREAQIMVALEAGMVSTHKTVYPNLFEARNTDFSNFFAPRMMSSLSRLRYRSLCSASKTYFKWR